MLGFQGPNEFVGVGKELTSGYGEFLCQGIRNLIEGRTLLQQLPDFEADWIEAETDALFNIQEHSPIFGCSLPDACCDREVSDGCWLAHVAPYDRDVPSRQVIPPKIALDLGTRQKLFLLQESVQSESSDDMIPTGVLVRPIVARFQSRMNSCSRATETRRQRSADFGGSGTHFSKDVIGSLVYGAWRDGTQWTPVSFTVEILAAKRDLSRSFLMVLRNSECRERMANPSLLQSGGSPATFDP